MYKIVSNFEYACFLGISSGTTSSEEWEQVYETIRAIDRSATQKGIPSVSISFVERNAERPNANRRSEMAQIRRELKAPLRLSVFACDSVLIRGFLRSLDWISPKPSSEKTVVVATFEEATTWVEAQVSRPLPILSVLYQDLQRSINFPLP